MRVRIYNFLVNKHPGIRDRYHRFHDGSYGMRKIFSWFYLLWLNFCYYLLFCRFLDTRQERAIYEEKQIPIRQSESELAAEDHGTEEDILRELSTYDVISFDIFDTLIFRPFSEPSDLFFFVGENLGFMDFKRIRVMMEAQLREECRNRNGNTEITLEEIWEKLQQETGISAEIGMQAELDAEYQFCYANSFLQQIYYKLQEQGKKIIIISDMYLPEAFLRKLLEKNGYSGFDSMFVSCEYRKNKATGTLFELVKSSLPQNANIVHIGDHPGSDVKMAKRAGFAAVYYPNVNRNALLYRSYDMSPVIGGAYRGIVDNNLYSGNDVYGMEYEYGFVYGGLFVLGYCNFIHEYCRNNEIDRILFLSRDGDILKQVYDRLFPDENTKYVYWSRAAAAKLSAGFNKYDYYRRFLDQKVNQNYTLGQILESMELEQLLAELPGTLKASELLTDKNICVVKEFLDSKWSRILSSYEEQQSVAKDYYSSILYGCNKVCAVDIGWAGSGAITLDYLVEKVWKIPCQVVGIIAGTNTVHNTEPEASEMFLQSGKLVSYLFSQTMNRDLMKKHDPNRDYNIFWELLLASPTGQFKGFSYEDGTHRVKLCFGKSDANTSGIKEIQRGILDFAEQYMKHFGSIPYMLRISGRDAYAPMLVAAGREERYLKTIAKKFSFTVNV